MLNSLQVTFQPSSLSNDEALATRSLPKVHMGLPIKVYHTCAVRGAVSWSNPVWKEAKKGVEEIDIDPPSPVLYPHHGDPSQASSSNDPPPANLPLQPRQPNPLSYGVEHQSVVTPQIDLEDDCNPEGTGAIKEDCFPSHVTATVEKQRE